MNTVRFGSVAQVRRFQIPLRVPLARSRPHPRPSAIRLVIEGFRERSTKLLFYEARFCQLASLHTHVTHGEIQGKQGQADLFAVLSSSGEAVDSGWQVR
jgi:hypothetical protein